MKTILVIFSLLAPAAVLAQDPALPKDPPASTLNSSPPTLYSQWVTVAKYYFEKSAAQTQQIAALNAQISGSAAINQILAKVTVLESAIGSVKVWVLAGQTQATVTWDAVPGATGYRVERSTDMVNYDQRAALAGVTLSFVDKPLTSGAYWYRVRATNAEAVSVPSNIASITLQ